MSPVEKNEKSGVQRDVKGIKQGYAYKDTGLEKRQRGLCMDRGLVVPYGKIDSFQGVVAPNVCDTFEDHRKEGKHGGEHASRCVILHSLHWLVKTHV